MPSRESLRQSGSSRVLFAVIPKERRSRESRDLTLERVAPNKKQLQSGSHAPARPRRPQIHTQAVAHNSCVKVYISADIEGITGLVSWSQCGTQSSDHYDYPFARRMMT